MTIEDSEKLGDYTTANVTKYISSSAFREANLLEIAQESYFNSVTQKKAYS